MSNYFLNQKIDVVILCGGIGSRIKNYSKGVPKSLIEINKKNILTYLLNEIKKYNFNKIFLLTGYKSKAFYKYNKSSYNFIPLECVKENKPMGTGGALYNLKYKKINNFILLNGDTILPINFKHLIKGIKNKIGAMTLVKNRNYKNNSKLTNLNLENGIVKIDSKKKFMNGGIYFFNKNILKYISNKRHSLENDLLKELIIKKKINGIATNQFFLDIGTPKNLKAAPKLLEKTFKGPAAFLDRDGVINFDYGYVSSFKNFKLRPGVIKGLKLLCKKNYKVFIVTNQAGIAKNFFKEKDFIKLHLKIKNFFLKKNIIINDVLYCPYHIKGVIKKYKKKSIYRKPNNGMIKKLFNNYDIIKPKSFMIGDKTSDEKCALKSRLYFEYAHKNFYPQIKKILEKRSNV